MMSARCCRAVRRPDPVDGAHRSGPRSPRSSGAGLTALAVAALAAAIPTAGLAGPAGATTMGAAVTSAAPTPTISLSWAPLQPATSPPPVTGASAAWDGDTSTVVLFGGVSAGGAMGNDTWTWDGNTWTDHPASATNAPPARQQAAMAFDPALHRLILFGGQSAGGTLLQDTWAWNGQQWTELSTGDQPGLGPSPSARSGAAMAFDPAGDLVLYGGTGYGPTETPVATTTTTTPGATPAGGSSGGAGSSAAPAATPRTLGDTWQWTASGWVLAATSGPPALTGASLTFDSSAGSSVLFGGSTSPAGSPSPAASNQTWVWNGQRWAAAKSPAAPPARSAAVLADAPALGGVVLLGGASSSGLLADGWLWTPAGWAAARVSGGFAPRAGAAWAADVPTQEGTGTGAATLVFGGHDAAGNVLGDTGLLVATKPAPTSPSTHPTPPTTTPAHSGPTIPTVTPGSGGAHPKVTVPAKGRTTSTTTARSRPSAPTTTPAPPPVTFTQFTIESAQGSFHRGATVLVTGRGFRPGSPVTISFHSTPALVGRAIADASGAFSAFVSVPEDATPGQHHFMASGTTVQGTPAELTAAVMVVAPPAGPGPSTLTKVLLSGLALLVPGATWLAMAGAGWWRRRSAHRPATD